MEPDENAGDCTCDHRINEPHDEEGEAFGSKEPQDTSPDDVFIVEGRQERYGDKSAWNVAAR